MATVFNNIDRPDGQSLTGSVYIELSWDTSVDPVARIVDEDTMVRGTYGSDVDIDGHWEVSLTPNDEILPADSVYKVTESINAVDVVYYISVPNGATPISWVGDILVDEPDWID